MKMRSKIVVDNENRYRYPRSEEIAIHRSDLQIQLENFKKRILSSFSIFDLLAVISLWTPILSGEFKSRMGLSSEQIQAGYVVFAAIITFLILVSRTKYHIASFFSKNEVSADPKIMAEKILEKCDPESKG